MSIRFAADKWPLVASRTVRSMLTCAAVAGVCVVSWFVILFPVMAHKHHFSSLPSPLSESLDFALAWGPPFTFSFFCTALLRIQNQPRTSFPRLPLLCYAALAACLTACLMGAAVLLDPRPSSNLPLVPLIVVPIVWCFAWSLVSVMQEHRT